MIIDPLTLAENERRFVAEELHDHIAQTLLQMNMQVSICKKFLELGHEAEAKSELDSLMKQINKGSQQLRDLIADLRPPASDDGSFDSALEQLVNLHHQRGGATVTLIKPDSTPLSGKKKLAVIRIVQEILQNIRKHAQANSVRITLEQNGTTLYIKVDDDGVGFDDALIPNPLAEKGGAGMINMMIRAAAIEGYFDIEAQSGEGTSIQVTIPL